MRKKKQPVVREPDRRDTNEARSLDEEKPDTPIRFFRGYRVIVKGSLPTDLDERVSRLHSSALRSGVRTEGKELGRATTDPNPDSQDDSDDG